MGFKREDIRDTSPLSLKKLNDTLRYLWLHSFGNIEFGDLSNTAQGVINNKVSNENFSSLIEQNPNSVKIAVGQIGGNNLIKNSHGYFGQSNWSINAPNMYIATDTGDKGIIIYNSGTASTHYYDKTVSQAMKVKPGIKHTISFYVTGKGENFMFGIKDSNYNTIFGDYTIATNANQTETKYTVTFIPNVDTIILQVYLGQYVYGALLYFYCKLEEGENATAWSPNANEIKTSVGEFTDDHFRVSFQDGSYSEMNNQGFKWHNGATSKDYHHLSYQTNVITLASTTTSVRVQLPDEFKSKDFYAQVSLNDTYNTANFSNYLLKITAYVSGQNTANGTIDVIGYAYTTNGSVINLIGLSVALTVTA